MPIYEYECSKCGRFEAVQKVSDAPLKERPDCDRKDCPHAAVKLMSPSAFHLKGSGWYKTDYTKSGTANTAKPEKKKDKSESASTDAPKADKAEKKDTSGGSSGSGSGGGCGPGCGCHS